MKDPDGAVYRQIALVASFVFGMLIVPARARTVFLDTFDTHENGASLAGAIPEVGDSWTVEEGAFERQLVQPEVCKEGKALRLTRIQGEKQRLRGEADPVGARLKPGCTIALRADFLRADPAQAGRLVLTPMGMSGFKPCIWMKANGSFHVWSCTGSEWQGKWVDTGVAVGSGVWCTLEIEARYGAKQPNGRIAGVYDAFATRHTPGQNPVRTCIAKDIPAAGWASNAWVHFIIENYDYQQEETGSETFWDNVELRVEWADKAE